MTPTPVPPLVVQSAAELMALDLPPVQMIVGDILPAGLVLLAGDPKAGKSLLLQDLAVSVTTGELAWGCYPVEPGDVLYLAREGGMLSFHDRLDRMLDGAPPPSCLGISYDSLMLGSGLEEQVEGWLLGAVDPRLVVIDTYTAVAPETRGVNRHREEYATLAGLADLATRWPKTLFVVVHHTRKGDSGEDVMQRISGSQGMTAVTDGNAVLSRHVAAGQCVLNIRPRNAEESELLLERDPGSLRWRVVGTDERSQLSGPRQQVLAWLDTHAAGGSPKDIADDLQLARDSVRQLLVQMEKSRQVIKKQRGLYTAVGAVAGDLALPA